MVKSAEVSEFCPLIDNPPFWVNIVVNALLLASTVRILINPGKEVDVHVPPEIPEIPVEVTTHCVPSHPPKERVPNSVPDIGTSLAVRVPLARKNWYVGACAAALFVTDEAILPAAFVVLVMTIAPTLVAAFWAFNSTIPLPFHPRLTLSPNTLPFPSIIAIVESG